MPTITLDASFLSRALATLVGTVAGFLFSIVVFYVSEGVKRSRDRQKIIAGLNREAAFNIGLCESWLKSIGEIRLKVASGDRVVFDYFDYSRALRIFVGEALKAGVLYDLLNDSELVELDKALRFLGPPSEQDINGKVAQWKAATIAAPEFSQALNFQTYVVNEARKAMDPLRKKTATHT
jgi:putative component of toxin-antitoxin plasmid stabilization module